MSCLFSPTEQDYQGQELCITGHVAFMYAGIVQTVQSLCLPTISKHTVRELKKMWIINASECRLTSFLGWDKNNPDGSSSIRRWKKLYGLACDLAFVHVCWKGNLLPLPQVSSHLSLSQLTLSKDTKSKLCSSQVTFSGGAKSAPCQKVTSLFRSREQTQTCCGPSKTLK